ncbi:MAG TPA: Sir2 family NAD-dependent protein deacetylase [Candidatus Binatia bacterium]
MPANIERAAEIVLRSRYVVALTGAGMSVESGIPPFRGPGGLWTKYGEPPMNGYQRFLADPAQAWRERLSPSGPMRELWETLLTAEPNSGHHALAQLESAGILRCLITQNVDNLHRLAGSQLIEEIHGNYTLIRCIQCTSRFTREEIRLEALPPHCPRCDGILKSDTVSFGEPIPTDVLARCFEETEKCDCMLVAGTSATVYPAAQFPIDVRQQGGQLIEINPHETELTAFAAISLRAPSAVVLPELAGRITQLRTA